MAGVVRDTEAIAEVSFALMATQLWTVRTYAALMSLALDSVPVEVVGVRGCGESSASSSLTRSSSSTFCALSCAFATRNPSAAVRCRVVSACAALSLACASTSVVAGSSVGSVGGAERRRVWPLTNRRSGVRVGVVETERRSGLSEIGWSGVGMVTVMLPDLWRVNAMVSDGVMMGSDGERRCLAHMGDGKGRSP